MAEKSGQKNWGYRILLILNGVISLGVVYELVRGEYPLFVIIAGVWLLFTLPICIMYLCGHPLVWSLSPLVDCPESRAYQRELDQRMDLSDDAFLDQFYRESNVRRDIPLRIRRLLAKKVDSRLARVHPNDLLYLTFDDLDLGDVWHMVEKEFGLKISRQEVETWDGSFEWLVQSVHRNLQGARAKQPHETITNE